MMVDIGQVEAEITTKIFADQLTDSFFRPEMTQKEDICDRRPVSGVKKLSGVEKYSILTPDIHTRHFRVRCIGRVVLKHILVSKESFLWSVDPIDSSNTLYIEFFTEISFRVR